MSDETEIIICGDLCPTKDTQVYFDNNDVDALFNDILPVFKGADYVLGNLEFVLSDSPSPIEKSGPVLYGRENYIDTLKTAGVRAVSLANNHIKDCGEEGILSTINSCKRSHVEVFGAGKNTIDARKPLIKIIGGHRIGIIAFAEQEFNSASETEYGANCLDMLEDFDRLKSLKEDVDYLIVLYHGGIEHFEYPSPLLQKKCRKFIDKGADLVTCQHSHCVGTFENYSDGKILYGQGNTLFGYRHRDDKWNRGLLIKLRFDSKGVKPHIELIPIEATCDGVRLMEKSQGKELLNQLNTRSIQLGDKSFVARRWQEFCETRKELYFPYLFGYSRLLIHINRLTGNSVIRALYSRRKIRTSLNIVRCESHAEVMTTILEKESE
ncbi:CapA family protein [Schleiferiaceae bacterium]|nr:CapA family protein [Schleiferiaceae bacterium]